MNGELRTGAILHYQNFEFSDGTRRNKYMIVLGAKHGHNYLCVLTTSNQWRMKAERGCHHTPRTHFFIPGDGKNFFPKHTWVLLSEPTILNRAEAVGKGLQNIIQIVGNLEENITGQIRNCLKASRDISEKEIQLL